LKNAINVRGGGHVLALRLMAVDIGHDINIGGPLRDRFERLALVTQRRLHPESVNGIGQQQDLDAARLEAFQMRARRQPPGIIPQHIPDGGLAIRN
jgi:hypothetical protein